MACPQLHKLWDRSAAPTQRGWETPRCALTHIPPGRDPPLPRQHPASPLHQAPGALLPRTHRRSRPLLPAPLTGRPARQHPRPPAPQRSAAPRARAHPRRGAGPSRRHRPPCPGVGVEPASGGNAHEPRSLSLRQAACEGGVCRTRFPLARWRRRRPGRSLPYPAAASPSSPHLQRPRPCRRGRRDAAGRRWRGRPGSAPGVAERGERGEGRRERLVEGAGGGGGGHVAIAPGVSPGRCVRRGGGRYRVCVCVRGVFNGARSGEKRTGRNSRRLARGLFVRVPRLPPLRAPLLSAAVPRGSAGGWINLPAWGEER